MPRTWIITTGTSVSGSSRCWNMPPGLATHDALIQAAFIGSQPVIAKQLADARDRLFAGLGADDAFHEVQAESLVTSAFRSQCWENARRNAMPAELATFIVLDQHGAIRKEDHLLLVAGRSNVREARVLEAMLRPWVRCRGATVEIIGPFALDPTDRQQFQDSIKIVWSRVIRIEGDKSFVLTGGYKGVLIGLSLALGQSRPVPDIYYLHEESQDVIAIGVDDQGHVSQSVFKQFIE